MIEPCFECGQASECQHHVVPRSRGGTKTIPLCGSCHGKAHHLDKRMSPRELTKAALQAKKTRGERTGCIPYGFDLAADGITLVENPHEQEGIKAMLALRGYGYSFRDIGTDLEDQGYFTKGGGKWQPMTVRNICQTMTA